MCVYRPSSSGSSLTATGCRRYIGGDHQSSAAAQVRRSSGLQCRTATIVSLLFKAVARELRDWPRFRSALSSIELIMILSCWFAELGSTTNMVWVEIHIYPCGVELPQIHPGFTELSYLLQGQSLQSCTVLARRLSQKPVSEFIYLNNWCTNCLLPQAVVLYRLNKVSRTYKKGFDKLLASCLLMPER